MKPSTNDSTSMSALSDSTTTTVSPLLTASPSDLSQLTIFPSVMVELSAGMKISRTLASTRTLRRPAVPRVRLDVPTTFLPVMHVDPRIAIASMGPAKLSKPRETRRRCRDRRRRRRLPPVAAATNCFGFNRSNVPFKFEPVGDVFPIDRRSSPNNLHRTHPHRTVGRKIPVVQCPPSRPPETREKLPRKGGIRRSVEKEEHRRHGPQESLWSSRILDERCIFHGREG